jgi:hypothetical protein
MLSVTASNRRKRACSLSKGDGGGSSGYRWASSGTSVPLGLDGGKRTAHAEPTDEFVRPQRDRLLSQ